MAWINMTPAQQEQKNARQRRNMASMGHFCTAYKLFMGCVDCGYCVDALALDFDHVRGVKLFSVAERLCGWRTLVTEIEKCEIRCANCHRIRTWKKRTY